MLKLKSFLKNNNIVAKIFGLGIFKFLNIIITFATLPYLLRVMGAEQWGEIVFIQLIINYMVWFVNWGFYHGATRRVAQNKYYIEERTKLFSEVWFAQFFFTVIVIFVFVLVLLLFPININVKLLYISSIGLIIGNFLSPLWYLNGLEFVKESEIVLLLNKLLVLPFIFLFVTNDKDGYLYLLLNSIASISVGFFCLLWLRKKGLFFLSIPKLKKVLDVISQDSIFFMNNFFYTFNSSIVPFVLGASSNMSQLGYYNLAERVRGVAVTCLQPVTHALFPRMCYLFSTDSKAAQKMLKISGAAITFLAIIISLILFFYAKEIVVLMVGEAYIESIDVLKVMAFSAFVVTLSAFLTDQVIIPNNLQKIISYAVLISSVFIALLVYPIVNSFGSLGGAWLSLAAQLLVLFMLTLFLCFKKKY